MCAGSEGGGITKRARARTHTHTRTQESSGAVEAVGSTDTMVVAALESKLSEFGKVVTAVRQRLAALQVCSVHVRVCVLCTKGGFADYLRLTLPLSIHRA